MSKLKKFPLKIIPILTLPFSVLFPVTINYAEIPDSAQVTQIVGSNSLGIRRRQDRKFGIVHVGTVMQLLDKLDIPSDGRTTFAKLSFFNKLKQEMGLEVQASVRNNLRTSYYFPCLFESKDVTIIEWTNEKTKKRGCEKGFKIRTGTNSRGIKASQKFQDLSIIASLKNLFIAQQAPSAWRYCTVANKSGKGWMEIADFHSNPCRKILEECEKTGECSTLTFDYWRTDTPELMASISCSNNQNYTIKGTGQTIKDQIERLWEEAETQKSTFCGLQVLSPEDALVEPVQNEEVSLVEIGNVDPCLAFRVYKGKVNVKSVNHAKGTVVGTGQQYQYCLTQQPDSTTPINTSIESIDMQIFLAKSRGYEFCNKQQASGGQKGDRRTIQLTSTSGEIRLDYEMFSVPDRLKIVYENRELVNTGFVSGSKSLSIPFKGNSGQVTVEITGNPEESGTQWNYNLYCPQ